MTMFSKLSNFSTITVLAGALVAATVTFVSVDTANANQWQRYNNSEFGFKIDYPTSVFHTIAKSESGDGALLESRSGNVKLNVYSFPNKGGLSHKSILRTLRSGYSGDRKITYTRATPRWIVVSGYKNSDSGKRTIFYERLAISRDGGRLAAFELNYPVAMRSKIDPLVKRISRSLTAPK